MDLCGGVQFMTVGLHLIRASRVSYTQINKGVHCHPPPQVIDARVLARTLKYHPLSPPTCHNRRASASDYVASHSHTPCPDSSLLHHETHIRCVTGSA
jgi:hypothetical protein